jgi:hypothetical protein
MDDQSFIRRIHSFILDTNLLVLIGVPILLGFAVFGLMFVIWPNGFTGTHAQGLWISLGWFCFSISGIPKLVRRETFIGIIYFKGKLAIIDGFF